MERINIKLLVRIVLLINTCFCISISQSNAQVLEEVIVTAQKRAESLQDVSVSVTALSGEKLTENSVARLEEITAYVPNFTMSETGIGTNIYIRGIGSGINQGFEQSVGMYFDGIYYARAQLARAPIFDAERVEVLRGPQVTLFGNNSIGGAVSITSAKPTDTFESSVSFLYEPDHHERETQLVLSGPITEQFKARLALRKYDLGGYMENVFLARDEPNRDYLTSRATFSFEPESESFLATLKYENSSFDVVGRQISIIRDLPTNYRGLNDNAFVRKSDTIVKSGDVIKLPSFFPEFTPGEVADFSDPNLSEIYRNTLHKNLVLDTDPTNDLIFQSINGQQVIYPGQFQQRASNNDSSINDVDNVTFSLSIPLDSGQLDFISGYLNYSYEEVCDCDFTAAELIEYNSEEEYRQVSQEIRFTSELGSKVDFIVGGYYQNDNLEFSDIVTVIEDTALEETLLVMFSDANVGQVVGVSVPRDFQVDNELFSGFAQATINLSESTRLMLGVRESRAVKYGRRELNYILQDLATPLDGDYFTGQYSTVSTVFNLALNINPHLHQNERKEKRTSWSVLLEQDFGEDTMAYLSAVRGYKGGGFDTRSNAPSSLLNLIDNGGGFLNAPGTTTPVSPINFKPGTFEFEDEEALAFELGLKTRLFDRAEINMAYFYTVIEDLQLSVFDGGAGFNVSNAGEAVTQGVEIDGRFAITEQWSLSGSLAWLDFEFTDYKDGLCTSADTLAMEDGDPLTEPVNCREEQVISPDFGPLPVFVKFADLTGETNQYVADYSGSIALNYESPYFSGMQFKGSFDVNFTDDYNPAQNLDPGLQQGGYEVYNLRLALKDTDDTWEVAILGRNITDREIVSYANDVPLAASLFGTQTSYGFIQRTASWAMQFTYRFRADG